MKRTQVFTNKDHVIMKKEMMVFFLFKPTLWFIIALSKCFWLELVSQVSDVVHGPLVNLLHLESESRFNSDDNRFSPQLGFFYPYYKTSIQLALNDGQFYTFTHFFSEIKCKRVFFFQVRYTCVYMIYISIFFILKKQNKQKLWYRF